MKSFVVVFLAGCTLLGNFANSDTGNNSTDVSCSCTLEYQPVCGSDFHTYPNYCDLQCAMLHNGGLHALCPGTCPCPSSGGDEEQKNSSESRETSHESVNKQVEAESEGSDFEENTENSTDSLDRCMCPRILSPMCGSNNVTYANNCMLVCGQQEDIDLVKVHDGECSTIQP